ncbi:MAG: GGDEF domain-containing protein [Candidatus Obscuribacterales bacterium]|nr:GGDEF domain-containing protein [Candidatus Obscuribacterales bacterium]
MNVSVENDLNYANFLDRLNLELERSKRYNRSFSICLFSLGGGGDELMSVDVKPIVKDLSQLICDVARIPDIVVSCSSEELALIMPETPLPGAFTAADRIRQKLSTHAFTVDGNEMKATVSMGIAAFPDHAGDAESLARVARQAMELGRKREPNSIVSASELGEEE